METLAPWPQLNPEFWRGLGLMASIENFKMKNTLWSTKTHSTQKYDTQHWPTRLKQTRQLRPEDWSKSPSKSLVWLGFSPWLAIQSHGQFCSSRIQTFTKGLCFICCEADYHLISEYKQKFPTPQSSLPPRLCLQRYNKLLRRKYTSHHMSVISK